MLRFEPNRRHPRALGAALLLSMALAGCPNAPHDGRPDAGPDAAVADAAPPDATVGDAATPTAPYPVVVMVTLDGDPAAGATVSQGGNPTRWRTNHRGRADVMVDPDVIGDWALIASHPEARQGYVYAPPPGGDPVTIALTRFATTDNTAYRFQDPGDPDRRDFPTECAHCHVTGHQYWYASAHRTTASNPRLRDLYAGAAGNIADAAACSAAGGQWLASSAPGTGAPIDRCFLGDGVISTLNPNCGPGMACPTPPTNFGACADCHAPGIDGNLGGRDLRAASGLAFKYGVHCDVCHKVSSIELAAPPGVAGRLQLLRPSEPLGLGEFVPLFFGPRPDIANGFMGSVARDIFANGVICAGCHEQDQAVLVPGATIDSARWPSGRIPIHSTYAEWVRSPLLRSTTCVSCHMPPDPVAGNSIDLGNILELPPGIREGWYREPGTVRKHSFTGPRSVDASALPPAATLVVATDLQGTTLDVAVTVRNLLGGHALPTGEPMRHLVLIVEARCGASPQPAIGGDAIPDFGGYLARQEASGDWSRWPGAEVGQVVRVVRRPGGYYDYAGIGPFGDGTFGPAAKGMPREEAVGSARIIAMNGDQATFDVPLPAGDIAYLGESADLPRAGLPAVAVAGGAGFAFARVLVGALGRRMVPHFLAVDVASDNRLPPYGEARTAHRFSVSCPAPVVEAALLYRAYPHDLAAERRWALVDRLLARSRTP